MRRPFRTIRRPKAYRNVQRTTLPIAPALAQLSGLGAQYPLLQPKILLSGLQSRPKRHLPIVRLDPTTSNHLHALQNYSGENIGIGLTAKGRQVALVSEARRAEWARGEDGT